MMTPTRARTTTRAAVLLAGAIAATLALTACTTPEPKPTPSASATATPTPTPTTPTEVPAPQSEDEAVAGATEAMERYLSVRSAIYVDPQTTQDIDAVTDGDAAVRLKDTAAQLAELGGHGEGAIAFDVQSAFAVPLVVNGAEVPFAQVNLKGCYDTTKMELFNADGSPSEVSDIRRFITEPVLIYRSSTSSWVVYQLPSPETVEQC